MQLRLDPASVAVAINDNGLIVANETVYAGNGDVVAYNAYLLSAQVVIFSPNPLAFGNQPVGTPSAARSVTSHEQ